MLTYLRYALATFCFAASVGCLAIWWRSTLRTDFEIHPGTIGPYQLMLKACDGCCVVRAMPKGSIIFVNISSQSKSDLFELKAQERRLSYAVEFRRAVYTSLVERYGRFGHNGDAIHFPLWYPALIFALGGVAVLRLGRRFTLRSAIIATRAFAGLLRMAVGG